MCNKNYTLITGASEGFGKALALECAGRYLNLVLVALPGSGLANLACYIERNYEVRVLFFEHDLSKKEECIRLFEEIKQRDLKINMLINNAGMGGTHFFEERDAEYYYKQIELNVIAPIYFKRRQPGEFLLPAKKRSLWGNKILSRFFLKKPAKRIKVQKHFCQHGLSRRNEHDTHADTSK
jgi:short-subunit dehydrogenase